MPAPQRNVIEAPGEITLTLIPAGIGSRFLAALIDTLMVAGVVVTLEAAGVLPTYDTSLFQAAALLLYVAWFASFEMVTGRTPGKAALELRVLLEDGQAIDTRGAIVRNLLRLAWVFPAAYLMEILVVTLDGRTRRLGDLLAGTIVVSERISTAPIRLFLNLPSRAKPRHDVDALDQIALSPAEYQALRTFCFRTRTLTEATRQRLARRILAPLYARAGLPSPATEDQEELLVDLMHRENDSFTGEADLATKTAPVSDRSG